MKSVIKPTPEQEERIRSIRQTYHPRLKAAVEYLHQAQESLQDVLLDPQATPPSVEQRVEDTVTARAELIRLRATLELEIKKLLTPAQVTNLKEYRDRMRDLHRAFWERRRSLIKEFTEPRSE